MKISQTFYDMENAYPNLTQDIHKLQQSVKNLHNQISYIQELQSYYGSETWYQDRELDDLGQIPDDQTRTILGEDAIYHSLIDLHELAIEMLELSTFLLK